MLHDLNIDQSAWYTVNEEFGWNAVMAETAGTQKRWKKQVTYVVEKAVKG